ncbi:major facilitator superfamily domain-containing protein [Dunaliella salina]|uniref:Major facilitator superfamily domain-containing protein n=1 Tax=Dunaliella salina TaxID=3046 RepID=A0ABQ7H0Q2_DUNSA|nr:major facilitator superfamily domain-containing protein [Dunaliella salina]|eukprot:KAF5840434.1 major facilitator superfamily domain-containing protein [Dunaliella salina]
MNLQQGSCRTASSPIAAAGDQMAAPTSTPATRSSAASGKAAAKPSSASSPAAEASMKKCGKKRDLSVVVPSSAVFAHAGLTPSGPPLSPTAPSLCSISINVQHPQCGEPFTGSSTTHKSSPHHPIEPVGEALKASSQSPPGNTSGGHSLIHGPHSSRSKKSVRVVVGVEQDASLASRVSAAPTDSFTLPMKLQGAGECPQGEGPLSNAPHSHQPDYSPYSPEQTHCKPHSPNLNPCSTPHSPTPNSSSPHAPQTSSRRPRRLQSMKSFRTMQSLTSDRSLSKASTFRPSGTFKLRLDDGHQVELEADNVFPPDRASQLDEGAPLDSEMRSRRVKIFSFEQPHMRTFHLAWMALALAFMGAYAAATLKPVIRDSIDLTSKDLGHADVASVVGMVLSRLLVMYGLDKGGPRYGIGFTMMLLAPCICCSALVASSGGFIVVRLLCGFGAAMFPISAHWTASMFSPNCVGLASAYVIGWGSSGVGLGVLILPAIHTGIAASNHVFASWRWTLIIPGALCALAGICVLLLAQDKPCGDQRTLKTQGSISKHPVPAAILIRVGLSNYRAWLLSAVYALTAGTELAVSNIITVYLFDQFRMSLETAGGLSALLGLMNVISCPFGGFFSDLAATLFGIRGRLWVFFIMQAIAGVFFLVMGMSHESLGVTVAMLILAGFTMNMAGGCGFPIVNFISYRGGGVVSGLVTAAGGVGGVILQSIFYGDLFEELHQGLLWNGVAMLASSFALFFMWWPCWGSMITPGDGKSSEMDYFIKEFSAEEINEKRHAGGQRFANETALGERRKWFQSGAKQDDPELPLDCQSKVLTQSNKEEFEQVSRELSDV